jgi:predicted HAD superfamily phosphohydrolase YqeG
MKPIGFYAETMQRVGYALRMGLRYRQAVAAVYHATPTDCRAVTLDMAALRAAGAQALALDFDGVLAEHGEPQPRPEVQAWLRECVAEFGAARVFVLTNKPLPARLRYFELHHPGVRCITGTRKKPYPDGLLHIAALSGVPPEQVRLLDDRLLVGVLAACIAGTQASYIRRPYTRLARRPLQELFFMALRGLERIGVKLAGRF